MSRINPFADLGDFVPKASSKPVEPAQIEQIAQENGFPSRRPASENLHPATKPRRRYTTGRNQQLNIKATAETIARFYNLADARRITLGELLERALTALEQAEGGTTG